MAASLRPLYRPSIAGQPNSQKLSKIFATQQLAAVAVPIVQSGQAVGVLVHVHSRIGPFFLLIRHRSVSPADLHLFY